MLKKKEIYKLIKSYDIGMMTNITEHGKLVSHPMTRQGEMKDDAIWFFSERNSEKVIELEKNRSVNISFSGDEYISVSGEVEIVDDVKIKKELWSKAMEAFYEGGPENDQIILNIFKNAFEFAKGIVTDKEPDLGENEAVEI